MFSFHLLELAAPLDLLAYLDPGTGSLILQAVLAAIATIAVMARLFWQRLLSFFKFRQPTPGPAPAAAGSEEPELSEAGDRRP